MKPQIVISLDFELRWGVQDKLGDDLDAYRANLEGVRDVVPATLELFQDRGVNATWACVGALACESWDEYETRAPAWPRYRDAKLAWNASIRTKDPRGTLYFAPELVAAIQHTPGQDLGSHTFSHVYMAEPGFMRRDALADTDAVLRIFRDRLGLQPKSFVFPRNQISFEDVLENAGFAVWRTNPTPFFWSATTAATQSALVRSLRLADSLVPLGSRATLRELRGSRASHFVRFTLPDVLWRAHVRRLVSEARRLRDNEALHLWWHPHNLGVPTKQRLQRLADLIDALAEHAPAQTRFSSMAELAQA